MGFFCTHTNGTIPQHFVINEASTGSQNLENISDPEVLDAGQQENPLPQSQWRLFGIIIALTSILCLHIIWGDPYVLVKGVWIQDVWDGQTPFAIDIITAEMQKGITYLI